MCDYTDDPVIKGRTIAVDPLGLRLLSPSRLCGATIGAFRYVQGTDGYPLTLKVYRPRFIRPFLELAFGETIEAMSI